MTAHSTSLMFRTVTSLTLAATLLGGRVGTLRAQSPAHLSHAPEWATYLRAFDEYVARDSIVGASTVVVEHGRIVARHDVGFADRALGQRVDSNTIFHWGSITKTLTAISAMELVEHHRLRLDERATRYVPELRLVHDPFGSPDSVTLEMLLSHSAGFQNPTWPYKQGLPWEPFEPTTWEQLVAMMPYQQIAFKPGSRFSYSNPGFIYIARMIEQITGDPWEGYVHKNIFTPLGLTHSYFGETPLVLAPYRSNNYTLAADSGGRMHMVANGRDFNPGITIPNGGWNAPLGDLATYLAFLTGYAPDSATRALHETIIPHRTLEMMWRPRFPTSRDSSEWMGLSFFTRKRNDKAFVGHTGSQAGFTSYFYWNPETGSGVIAAFNTENAVKPEDSARGFSAVRDLALDVIR